MILNVLILALMFSITMHRRDNSVLYALSDSDKGRVLLFLIGIKLHSWYFQSNCKV